MEGIVLSLDPNIDICARGSAIIFAEQVGGPHASRNASTFGCDFASLQVKRKLGFGSGAAARG
jgi:hypothetical protein